MLYKTSNSHDLTSVAPDDGDTPAIKRKKDATALAELIYDIYKGKQDSGKIINGQNNANETKDN